METLKYENGIEGQKIVVYADKRIYTKNSIIKCLYWYGGTFRTTLELQDEATFKITLQLINEVNDDKLELQYYLQKLERDLLDFQLREIVVKQTKTVRELLIAKAFANYAELQSPPGDIADPVGFDAHCS